MSDLHVVESEQIIRFEGPEDAHRDEVYLVLRTNEVSLCWRRKEAGADVYTSHDISAGASIKYF